MNKYFIKSFLLKSWLFEEYKKVGKVLFRWNGLKFLDISYKDISNEQDYDVTTALSIHDKYIRKYPHLWNECKKIYHSHLNRVVRLKKRISDMVLSGDCIFLTLTFSDDNLKRLSSIVRRQYIKEFLISLNAEDYVANIDYGDDHLYKDKKGNLRQATSREHFHAVVQIDRVNYKLWKYGRINGQKVRNQNVDMTRLSKYISKLTNHAIKESTKRCVILYKRKPKSSATEFGGA